MSFMQFKNYHTKLCEYFYDPIKSLILAVLNHYKNSYHHIRQLQHRDWSLFSQNRKFGDREKLFSADRMHNCYSKVNDIIYKNIYRTTKSQANRSFNAERLHITCYDQFKLNVKHFLHVLYDILWVVLMVVEDTVDLRIVRIVHTAVIETLIGIFWVYWRGSFKLGIPWGTFSSKTFSENHKFVMVSFWWRLVLIGIFGFYCKVWPLSKTGTNWNTGKPEINVVIADGIHVMRHCSVEEIQLIGAAYTVPRLHLPFFPVWKQSIQVNMDVIINDRRRNYSVDRPIVLYFKWTSNLAFF